METKTVQHDGQQAVQLEFEDITFLEQEHSVRGLFMGRYYFDLSSEDLEDISRYAIEDGCLVFHDITENYAWKRMDRLLNGAFMHLKHINYGKPTVYVHRHSAIPLVGTNEFGFVDRGSNVIEVKPLTGCNFQCPYCSVDEGKNDKTHDYVVELEYMLQEAPKFMAHKKHPVEFHIGPQGEPMLYPKFVELVRGLRSLDGCERITVVTNGSLLTERLIDELHDAGLTKINLSLNAVSQQTANEMSGKNYPLDHVFRMIEYCKGRIEVMIAPTIVPGWNDHEIEGLVQLGKQTGSDLPLGFQNFLLYKRGRNPVKKQRSWDEFKRLLEPHEEQSGLKLTDIGTEDLGIHEEPELEKPFRKRDIVRATVVCPARYPGEVVAAAKDRCITVMGKNVHTLSAGTNVKVRIVRDKHNIYKGVLVS